MRKTGLALLAVAVLAMLGSSVAAAGVTCQVVPSMCPPAPSGGGGSAVPEPGTLALLVAGVGAVGVALRRRRNKP